MMPTTAGVLVALAVALSSNALAQTPLPAASAPAVGSIPGAPSKPANILDEPPPSSDLVASGRYLASAAHCAACHTGRADRPLGGNLAIGSKFGTMYSSNITSDPTYGIGKWTEAQFTAALREGKGQHGEHLYPAMPYTDFTKITDTDVRALYAYFKTVPPIAEPTRKNQMKFPFNVRAGIGAWQAMFFKPGRYVDDPSQGAQWNRGAYLVEGLGHCGACHTPKNVAMADRKGRALQGAELDHWFAPDISGGRYSGIKDWSAAQIVSYLRTGHNDKNVAAVGPMLLSIARGTSELAQSDLQAMATYLKNQSPSPEDKLPRADFAWNAERKAAGAATYAANCRSCHGADGQGVDGVAPALGGNSSVTSKGPETVVRSVLEGFAPQGRWGVMPSFDQTLAAQDIADVANFVRTAWGAGNGPANASPSMVNKMRMDGVQSAPGVQAALVCPSAKTEQLDPATLDDITALAEASRVDRGDVVRLVSQYRKRHPGVDRSTTVNVLSGAYCRDVMAAAGDYAAKQQGFLTFMTRLSEASVAAR